MMRGVGCDVEREVLGGCIYRVVMVICMLGSWTCTSARGEVGIRASLRVDSNPKPVSRDFTKHIDSTKGKVSWE